METITGYSIVDKLSSISSQVKSDIKHLLDSMCSSNHLISIKNIIQSLSKILEKWGKNQLDLLGRSHPHDGKYCQLEIFGSQTIGTYLNDSDIDILCIGPHGISKDIFFNSFIIQLENCKEVTDVVPIGNAYVPIVKFKFTNISIDLLYIQPPPIISLAITTNNNNNNKNEFDIRDINTWKGLPNESIPQLNGVRVSQALTQLVPNFPIFQLLTRTIKLWSKKRGIYGNCCGYLGGISWTILCGKICQLFPSTPFSVLIYNFFTFYLQWNWPEPIALCDMEMNNNNNGSYDNLVWVPCLKHIMPIISPVYPSQNTSVNITKSTFDNIMIELNISYNFIVKDVIEKNIKFEKLIVSSSSFFDDFPYFIEYRIVVNNNDCLAKWYRWCESKTRRYLEILESNTSLKRIRLNTNSFKIVENKNISIIFYYGILPAQPHVDITDDTQLFIQFMSSSFELFDSESMNLLINIVTKNDIPKSFY